MLANAWRPKEDQFEQGQRGEREGEEVVVIKQKPRREASLRRALRASSHLEGRPGLPPIAIHSRITKAGPGYWQRGASGAGKGLL